MRQPVVAYGPVVTLNVSILLRLSRLDKSDLDTVFLRPARGRVADVLWIVIAADRLRFATQRQ